MDSVKLLNMAIFGLSLRTLNQIKQMVELVLPDAIQVNWTNIAHPDLNILLINDIFLESNNIQRLLKTKQMKVLKLASDQPNHMHKVEDTFFLHDMDENQLKQWLLHNIHIEPQITRSNKIQTTLPDKIRPLSNELTPLNLIKQITNQANGRIKIFDRFGELAICDTRMQWVWVNQNRDFSFTDLSINYTHATHSDLDQMNTKQHHLQMWLWTLLWKSSDYIDIAPQQGCFKLIRWPQPQLHVDHQDILKISTCFSYGADIEQVCQYLNMSSLRIRQFLAASIALGFVKEILPTEVNFNFNRGIIAQPEEVSKVKGFFNRLRKKLGL